MIERLFEGLEVLLDRLCGEMTLEDFDTQHVESLESFTERVECG